MVSTRKKRQTNKRLLSHLDDFDQNMIIGNAASARQENVVVNEGFNDRDFTVSNSSKNTAVNESAMNVKTLERCFSERIDREMINIVNTVEDRIQNAILTAIEIIVAPKIELAIRSINASSGQDVTSASATSERREYIGSIVPFENASENNNTLGVTKVNDETRHNIPDEVSELSVPETHFDRQAHTHHTNIQLAYVTVESVVHSVKVICSFSVLRCTPHQPKNGAHRMEVIILFPLCSSIYPLSECVFQASASG